MGSDLSARLTTFSRLDPYVPVIGMIRFDPSSLPPFGSDLLLWGGSFFLVVALHVVAVVGLQPDRSEGEAAGDPAVIIELETDSAAPLQGRSELTPGPEQVQTDQISQASVAQQQVIQRTRKEEEASPPKVDVATAIARLRELEGKRAEAEAKMDAYLKELGYGSN